ncbi:hypothetical protein EVAR_87795_1 [Eumeta japonica]|uniref:Uncharacterized protein n=1 Tax=Eumeta variegata TaxID=151549 RepID=A0A4C1X7H2_EUMVA|nr:hypothetical protein EVAR_87795_1 [Eumeta japonica]
MDHVYNRRYSFYSRVDTESVKTAAAPAPSPGVQRPRPSLVTFAVFSESALGHGPGISKEFITVSNRPCLVRLPKNIPRSCAFARGPHWGKRVFLTFMIVYGTDSAHEYLSGKGRVLRDWNSDYKMSKSRVQKIMELITPTYPEKSSPSIDLNGSTEMYVQSLSPNILDQSNPSINILKPRIQQYSCSSNHKNQDQIEELDENASSELTDNDSDYLPSRNEETTAKISKLLLLMEEGRADKFQGKGLNEIELNLSEEVIGDDIEESNFLDYELNDQQISKDKYISTGHETISTEAISNNLETHASEIIKKKKKRNLVPWTSPQKTAGFPNCTSPRLRVSRVNTTESSEPQSTLVSAVRILTNIPRLVLKLSKRKNVRKPPSQIMSLPADGLGPKARCPVTYAQSACRPMDSVLLPIQKCCARGRPIIVEWERDARHSAGLSLVRGHVLRKCNPFWMKKGAIGNFVTECYESRNEDEK